MRLASPLRRQDLSTGSSRRPDTPFRAAAVIEATEGSERCRATLSYPSKDSASRTVLLCKLRTRRICRRSWSGVAPYDCGLPGDLQQGTIRPIDGRCHYANPYPVLRRLVGVLQILDQPFAVRWRNPGHDVYRPNGPLISCVNNSDPLQIALLKGLIPFISNKPAGPLPQSVGSRTCARAFSQLFHGHHPHTSNTSPQTPSPGDMPAACWPSLTRRSSRTSERCRARDRG